MRTLTLGLCGLFAGFACVSPAEAVEGLSLPTQIATGVEYGDNISFVSEVAPVAYMADCCEPTCECGCGEDACGCGDDCGCGDLCGCGGKKKAKGNPCAKSHKGVFYANDFSYLKDPCYRGDCLGDCMKLMPLGQCGQFGTLDIGGQLRLRYHHEHGMGRQAGAVGFQDTNNDFLLTRMRLYTNWKVNDWLRFYCEGIVADDLANSAYLPRPIDRNYGDLLNCFIDVGVTENTTFRIGRQELVYGAQRQISPLDWANTRRTFQGVKMMHKANDWNIDAFYTNFVPVTPHEFDEADEDQQFYGVYATYTGAKSAIYDVYYIGYENANPYAAAPANQYAGTAGSADFSLHTFGGRIFADKGPLLFEAEAAYQTGRQSGLGLDHRAGMATVGFGKKLADTWNPTLWVYYDYASGNDSPMDTTFNRYNQLFPLAHKYLGFMDAVARSNISSPNCLLTMKPSSKLSLLAWYYYFGAAEKADTIPGVAVPSTQNGTSANFGNELDLIAKYAFGPRSNLLLGYSTLWRGSKIIGTDNAHFFYSQYTLNF